MKPVLIGVVVIVVAAVLLSFFVFAPSAPETMGRNRFAVIETNMGVMVFELFEDKAPITTKNFIDLSEKSFYDGIIFHRVIKDFMIQAGGFTRTGPRDCGYTIQDEFHPDLKHDSKGILSMANAGPNTGGSQFFVTLSPQPHLDGKHAVFGKLVDGEDVLEAIASIETSANNKPVDDVIIQTVTVQAQV